MKVLFLHDCAGVSLVLRDELRKLGHEADLFFFAEQPDLYLKYGGAWTPKQGSALALFVFRKILEDYDVIHTYSTRFPRHPLPYDFLLAKLARKKVAVHFHGDDLRLFPCRSQRLLFKNKVLLVSTPDLIGWCPKAEWLPNPVYPELFHPSNNESHDELRILHSSTVPKIKGTEYLVKAVANLRKKGYDIDLKIVGKCGSLVSHEEMPKLFGWCDIVVNELLRPIHSLIGIEAMYCNKPVMSNLNLATWHRLGLEPPPIINVSAATIQKDLEFWFHYPDELHDSTNMGRKWATRHHDPERVVTKLLEIYENA